MHAVECSYADLGGLAPYCSYREQNQLAKTTGVILPENVIEELRILGLPLGFYTRGELEDAVIACSFDNQLIDDKNGINFRDRLSLTNQEKLFQQRKQNRIFLCSSDKDDHEDGISYC